MIRVALLSKWHVHAEDYAQQVHNHPHLSIQQIWDDDPTRGGEWAKAWGVPFEKDLEKVLTNPEVDAVIVSTPTSQHKNIITAAAKSGKHIFTEKVLAFSMADCEEIFSAVAAANVQLMVSLPRLTEPSYLYAQDALDRGWLGRLTTIRCRLAHNGAVSAAGNVHGWLPQRFFNKEQSGGGALIDLGAHPIYLTNRLAGPAKSVMAYLQSTFAEAVDDNAVVLTEYASGALGIMETGFVAHGSPFQLELYGTEGALLIEEDHVRIQSSHFAQDGWVVPENWSDPLPMPMEQWVHAIQAGTLPSITYDDIRRLTFMNEVAALSDRRQARVFVNDMIEDGGASSDVQKGNVSDPS